MDGISLCENNPRQWEKYIFVKICMSETERNVIVLKGYVRLESSIKT